MKRIDHPRLRISLLPEFPHSTRAGLPRFNEASHHPCWSFDCARHEDPAATQLILNLNVTRTFGLPGHLDFSGPGAEETAVMESALKHWKRKQDEMERKHRQLLHDEELKFEQAKLVVNQSLAADRNKAFQDFSFAPRPLHPDLRRSLDDFLETQYSTQMRNCVLTYKLRLANLEEEKKQHLEALNQEMRADLDRYLRPSRPVKPRGPSFAPQVTGHDHGFRDFQVSPTTTQQPARQDRTISEPDADQEGLVPPTLDVVRDGSDVPRQAQVEQQLGQQAHTSYLPDVPPHQQLRTNWHASKTGEVRTAVVPTLGVKRKADDTPPQTEAKRAKGNDGTPRPCRAQSFIAPTRTISFDEVYQHGEAKFKHTIVEYPKNNGRTQAVQVLGYEVVGCTPEKVKLNNSAVQEALTNGYKPVKSTGSNRAKLRAHRLSLKIAQPRQLYLGFWADENEKRNYAVMLLPWTSDLSDAGLSGTLGSIGLLKNHPPRCFKFDKRKTRVLGWAPGFEDGGKYEAQRKFPVMYFDRPTDRSVGWIRVEDLSPFDFHDPNWEQIPFFQDAVEYYNDCRLFPLGAETQSGSDERVQEQINDTPAEVIKTTVLSSKTHSNPNSVANSPVEARPFSPSARWESKVKADNVWEVCAYSDDTGRSFCQDKANKGPMLRVRFNAESSRVETSEDTKACFRVSIDFLNVEAMTVHQPQGSSCKVSLRMKDGAKAGGIKEQSLTFDTSDAMGRIENGRIHARRFCGWAKSANKEINYTNKAFG
ncbi:hypothetical protein P8C59_009364 [Phyllachora maydis]|uniref:Uncharacterized protein n=1 Tax=Phyllachora maydis TaxID=1825666 RepID=A0AAD9ICG9_9PEZI|nr:hypothetical protein P8C59_009364 [Phyllachora maydis]